MGIGLTTEGNKGERANQVVAHVFKQPDADALVISLLNYLYVENPYADTSERNEAYTLLRQRVLEPRGVVLTENGFAMPDGRGIDELERIDRSRLDSIPQLKTTAEEPFAPMLQRGAVGASLPRDNAKVFVVHGRDARPVNVLRQFLLFLGLHVMEWSEAVALSGKAQPHTYDVVHAGMLNAAAVIVVFSPDDLARVKDDFSEQDDPDRTPQGQARQNVILEAGMAFGMARDRTIFVKSAPTREISDVAGFNWVKLDGAWDSRADLKGRLERAGAHVRPGNQNLSDTLAGPFQVS